MQQICLRFLYFQENKLISEFNSLQVMKKFLEHRIKTEELTALPLPEKPEKKDPMPAAPDMGGMGGMGF